MAETINTVMRDANTLAYRPQIEKPTVTTAHRPTTQHDTTSPLSQLTPALRGFLPYTPARTNTYLTHAITHVQSQKEKLRKVVANETRNNISFTQFEAVLGVTYRNEEQEAIYHDYYVASRDDVAGSVALDYYYALDRATRDLLALQQSFLKVSYNTDQPSDSLIAAEVAAERALVKAELSETNLEQINYPALACDALLGRSVARIASAIRTNCDSLVAAYEVDLPVSDFGGSANQANGIEAMFQDVSHLHTRLLTGLEREATRHISDRLLKQCKAKRERMVAAYQNESVLHQNMQDDIFVRATIDEHKRQALLSGREALRHAAYLEQRYADLKESCTKKQELRKIFNVKCNN